jgi:hypothetical protein
MLDILVCTGYKYAFYAVLSVENRNVKVPPHMLLTLWIMEMDPIAMQKHLL